MIFPLCQPEGLVPRNPVPDLGGLYVSHPPHLVGRRRGGVRVEPKSGGAIEYLSEFEPFNSRLWNKNENRAWKWILVI